MISRHKGEWDSSDLDRCEHGRHSGDKCFDCPNQVSIGNRFLVPLVPENWHDCRIGTTIYGQPIVVKPVKKDC